MRRRKTDPKSKYDGIDGGVKSGYHRRLPVTAAFLCLFLLCGCAGRSASEGVNEIGTVEEGIRFLQEQASGDALAVERSIKEARQQHRQETAAFTDASTDTEEAIREKLHDVMILGDSRAEPFSYLELLPSYQVYAEKNRRIEDADGGISQAISMYPAKLIFTYGLNSVSGREGALAYFCDNYREILAAYREALPMAEIYVCSIMPVTEEVARENEDLQQIPSYNTELQRLCEKEGYFYMDCDALLEEHPEFFEQDGMHFTAEAYPYWASMIWEKLQKNAGEAT